MPVGTRVFRVRAVDPVGNVDPTPATYTWQVGHAAGARARCFCGQIIRQSTKVKNDLADCLWDGLVIGAPGITIDLDGHTIDGKGLGAGIRNDGYDDVTIKNGRIVDFDYGVALNVGTERNIVEMLDLRDEPGSRRRPRPRAAARPDPRSAHSGAAALHVRLGRHRQHRSGTTRSSPTTTRSG